MHMQRESRCCERTLGNLDSSSMSARMLSGLKAIMSSEA